TIALLPAVADDGVPVAIRFGLVFGCDLKRECFALFEHGAAIEADTGNAHHGELNNQHIPFLARWKISWRALSRANGRVRKRLGVKLRRLLSIAVVPDANRIFGLLRHII